MAEPCQSIEGLQYTVTVTDRQIAEHQTAEKHSQNTAPFQQRGQPENQYSAADGQQRIKSIGERYTVNQLLEESTARHTESDTQTELADDINQEHPAQAVLAAADHLDERNGQKYGHRVVTS